MYDVILQNPEFVKAWSYYKDYLTEKGARFKSDAAENDQLEKLFELSGESAERAIEILNITMRNGYTQL
ncbi:hypothetical protein [Bacteroides sp.]|uniref:hypothetical protein n=1 Tax=Bacteroides sp. TaxID=29523 RepID=UPI003D1209A9